MKEFVHRQLMAGGIQWARHMTSLSNNNNDSMRRGIRSDNLHSSVDRFLLGNDGGSNSDLFAPEATYVCGCN